MSALSVLIIPIIQTLPIGEQGQFTNHKFPNWKENKYFKNQSKIYKLICNIFMRNKPFEIYLYKLLRKIKNT